MIRSKMYLISAPPAPHNIQVIPKGYGSLELGWAAIDYVNLTSYEVRVSV